jgi:hypothetical protein
MQMSNLANEVNQKSIPNSKLEHIKKLYDE